MLDQVDTSLWLYAFGATFFISLAPYLILYFFPLDNSSPSLKLLLSFASGGLLGDAFLHLIPHALMAKASVQKEGAEHRHEHSHGHNHQHSHHHHSHDHGHSHSHESHGHDLSVGLWVLAGIIVFLMVEKFVRIINGGHGHSHSHGSDAHEKEARNNESSETKKNQKTGIRKRKTSNGSTNKPEDDKLQNSPNRRKSSTDGGIRVSGYLNLAADFTHNLTDGLAIGASFLAGRSVGIVTTFTIFFHEIPHEIGDFAILIQSGCSRRKAMQLQLITALGAFTGTFISLFAEGYGNAASEWILPFTAGGFIYIATVSVIPELLENTSFWQSVKEIGCLLIGVSMMVLIAQYE